MAADVERIVEGLARVEERIAALVARVDSMAASTAHRHELDDLERRIVSLEGDRARIGWMVVAAVVTALLGLVVGLAP